MKPQHHIFGIRHHGPGSARRLYAALQTLQPDYILIEGPPEGTELLKWIAHPDLKAPVALLVYEPKSLERASYFPFAHFSPEWQAIQYAREHHLPVGFMDLSPNWYWKDSGTKESPSSDSAHKTDPLTVIAQTAGYEDGESWWEDIIETKAEEGNVFQDLIELMGAARTQGTFAHHQDLRTLRREAWMRQEIRRVLKSGFQRIAVVCGAFHSPVLTDLSDAKQDKALLKGMKKTKTRASWIPWTYDRLSFHSGYAAGVISPQWYSLIFDNRPQDRIIHWMSHAASLLRAEGLDASPAQVLESVRLTYALATLRGQGSPRLREIWDALETVFCPGDSYALELIERALIIGDRMGQVPEGVPGFPLQQDFLRLQKQLRMKPKADKQLLELDLRKEFHRKKSRFLHRLGILDIQWGDIEEDNNRDLGTFWERWTLSWQPECELQVLAAATWGNTIEIACRKKLKRRLREKLSLLALTQLFEQLLKADMISLIPDFATVLSHKIALNKDIQHLMEALPPLVRVMRYGDVRHTHMDQLQPIIENLLPRLIIGLPEACRNLGTDLAEHMYPLLFQTHNAIQLLAEFETLPTYNQSWHRSLEKLAIMSRIHPKLAGTACRLLFDYGSWPVEQAEIRMRHVLSPGTQAADGASWLEGFLSGSGLLLVHHPKLWHLLDTWVQELSEEVFLQSIPLLRRTFSEFAPAERRQIGQLAKGNGHSIDIQESVSLDLERVKNILPVWKELMGPDKEETT